MSLWRLAEPRVQLCKTEASPLASKSIAVRLAGLRHGKRRMEPCQTLLDGEIIWGLCLITIKKGIGTLRQAASSSANSPISTLS